MVQEDIRVFRHKDNDFVGYFAEFPELIPVSFCDLLFFSSLLFFFFSPSSLLFFSSLFLRGFKWFLLL